MLLSGFSASSQSPAWDWALAVGGAGSDNANAVATDAAGNVYTAGFFFGSVDFDPGTGTVSLIATGMSDVFVTKSDPSGNLLWAARLGGSSLDFAWGATTDNQDNVIITGSFIGTADFDPGPAVVNLTASAWSDVFVVKLSPAGNLIWAKSMGSSDNDDYGYGVNTDASGNVYVTGTFSGNGDFDPGAPVYSMTSAGGPDVFVCKLTSSGNFVWARRVGGAGMESGNSLIADGAGNVFITGYFSGSADFNPSASAVFTLSAAGLFDCFVLKLDASGDFGWAIALGGADDDYGTSVALDASSNLLVLGAFSGNVDFNPGTPVFNLTAAGDKDAFLCKFSAASGSFVWARAWGGTGIDEGLAVTTDIQSAVYVTGRFTGNADLDPGTGVFNAASAGWTDIYVLKLNSAGSFAWAKTAGSINDEVGKSITIDVLGRLFITGNFVSPSLTFGSASLSNLTSTADIFVARLASSVTGLSEAITTEALALFPNPASTHVTVLMPPAELNTVAEIYDMQGNLVRSMMVNRGTEMMSISVSDFQQGIYLVNLHDEVDAIGSVRLLVTR
jgi:hypothetical protein